MAGFDIDVPVIDSEREIARITLSYTQKIAALYELNFTFRWKNRTVKKCAHYYVTVDGRLAAIESWSRFLMSSIPYFVEGVCAGLKTKSMLGIVIPAAILQRLEEFLIDLLGLVSSVTNISNEFQIGSLTFDTGGLKHLTKPIKQLTELYCKYDNKEISAEVLIEQIHTVIESLLKFIYKNADCEKDLVAMAFYAKAHNLFSESEYEKIELIRKIRNKSKHKSQGIKDKTANQIIMPSAFIIHKLIRNLQKSPQHVGWGKAYACGS